ncbi:MAG: ABC transporter ATP-binding protein [Chloroflexi bacterium]|nr:ABC transporter ATP-binding protein [Chloroflexota bacterium]
MTHPLLRVQDLRVSYRTPAGDLPAVDGVSFSLAQGQALGLVGESGAGKSTIALALMRLLPRNVAQLEGEVELEGAALLSLPDEAFRREVRWRKIAMVFQAAQEAFNPVLRIGDQVTEPMIVLGGMSKAEARAEALRLLDLVRLPGEVFQRYPHELSGGMKQRAVIAMALALKPKLLLLDEPTSALDVTVQAQIMDQLKDLKRDLGLSVIFITHDIALASDICDTLGVMYAGKLAELGPAEAVLARPQHPYTRLLLASLPRLAQERPPQFIPGIPPDLRAPPSGCRFHPRCPQAFERCSREEPPLLAVGEGHTSRCWLAEGPGSSRRGTPE